MGHSVALAYDFFSWRAVLDILLISAGLFFLHRTLLRLGTWKIMAGIVLAFLSFFLNNYIISDGVLWYISQALVYSGAIFGVNIYFKTKLGNFENKVKDELASMLKQVKEGK